MNFAKVGDRVKHPTHGKGKVTKILGPNKDDGARVKLDSGKSVTVNYGDEDESKKWRKIKESRSVVEQLLGEGPDDADDGEPLEVTGPKKVENDAAQMADAIEQASERLAGFVDRRANANNPVLAKKLERIYLELIDIVAVVDGTGL